MARQTILALLFLAAVSGGTTARAVLVSGDIAIVGFQFDGTDAFSFVTFRDIAAGESFSFTDNGWQTSGSFRSGEGTGTFTAPLGGISAGTVTSITDIGTANFSASGDQILAYTGTSGSPSFIYSLHAASSGYGDATSSNTTGLPTGLTFGTTASYLGNFDNGVYSGSLSGTPSELLALIGDPANWTLDNNLLSSFAPGTFTIAPIPEPTAALCGSLLAGVLGLTVARRPQDRV